jgi:hypothetical protein
MNMDWPKCTQLSTKCWQKDRTRKLFHLLSESVSHLADCNVTNQNSEGIHQILRWLICC